MKLGYQIKKSGNEIPTIEGMPDNFVENSDSGVSEDMIKYVNQIPADRCKTEEDRLQLTKDYVKYYEETHTRQNKQKMNRIHKKMYDKISYKFFKKDKKSNKKQVKKVPEEPVVVPKEIPKFIPDHDLPSSSDHSSSSNSINSKQFHSAKDFSSDEPESVENKKVPDNQVYYKKDFSADEQGWDDDYYSSSSGVELATLEDEVAVPVSTVSTSKKIPSTKPPVLFDFAIR